MGWAEVADAVVNRRVELGMRTRQKFAEATDLSVKTLGEIERHERASYDKATLAVIEQVLKWPRGTIAAIANGTSAPEATPRPDDWDPATAGLTPIPPQVASLLAALEAMSEEERGEQLKQVGWMAEIAWRRVEHGRREAR